MSHSWCSQFKTSPCENLAFPLQCCWFNLVIGLVSGSTKRLPLNWKVTLEESRHQTNPYLNKSDLQCSKPDSNTLWLNDSVHGWPWTHDLTQSGTCLMPILRDTWVHDMISLQLSTMPAQQCVCMGYQERWTDLQGAFPYFPLTAWYRMNSIAQSHL